MLQPEMSRELTAHKLGRHGNGGPRKVYGIVLHDTAGSGTHGDTKYLATDPEQRGVSVDFTVERDGRIYQLNPDLRKRWCFHAGRHTSFKGLSNGQVNTGTVGIEIVQKANLSLTPVWPDEQVNAVADLCAWLCGEFELKKEDITTHARIITDGSRSDPRKWPWDLFWSYFNQYAQTGKDGSTAHLAEKVVHEVRSGDTLSSLSRLYQTPIETIKALNNLETRSDVIYVGQVLTVKE